MSCASSAASGAVHKASSPRRAWEIAGIILGFIFAWPLALAYLVWKFMGYPVPREAKEFFDKNFTHLSWNVSSRPRPHFSGTGNFAFEEYRRRELERLEAELERLRSDGGRDERSRRRPW